MGGQARPAFLGCAFSYRHRGFFVTARHCIGTLAASQIELVLPLADHDSIPLQQIDHHPEADLSLLYAGSIPPDEIAPFEGVDLRARWGDPVQAIGYPEEPEQDQTIPTGRLLAGVVQRTFTYSSPLGYEYRAIETGFGVPAGMSGGPLFSPTSPSRVIGVATENHDSTTYLRSVEEIQENGEVYRERAHHVIRYGLFVELEAMSDWLDGKTV